MQIKNKLIYKIKILLLISMLVACKSKAQDTTSIPVDQLVGKKMPQLFGQEYFLRVEAHEAYLQMQHAAAQDSIKLYIVSSYRGYEHQKKLWNKKFKKALDEGLSKEQALARCMEFSAIPGTSRHHWGTEVDLIDLNRPVLEKPLEQKEYAQGGNFEKLNNWLTAHANEYGFFMVYDDNPLRKGFHFEPWHFSFIPLASKFHTEYMKIDVKLYLTQGDILGSELFTEEFIRNYVADYVMQPSLLNNTNPVFLPNETK
jgi:LAS superfamily LD-carboxypeptidase LdcB